MKKNIRKSLLCLATLLLFNIPGFSQQKVEYKEPKFHTDWSKPSEYPDRIILNFGQNPSKEINITWRTSIEIDSAYVEIAKASGDPKFWQNKETLLAKTEVFDASEIVTAEVLAHYHSLEIKGLEEETIYGYRVGDGERWSEWFQFETASTNPDKEFSFLYVGDAQNYILELWSRLIREGFKTAPEAKFFIHAGDLINSAHREQEWHEWFTAGGFIHSMIPSVPTPGNHEYRAKDSVEMEAKTRSLSLQWNPQFTLPQNGPEGLEETVYYMDYQDTRIIALNSNKDLEIQAEWLENLLQNTKQKWKIITYHHPMYSASSGRDNATLREIWKPIFDKYNVDLALQGHDHSYARGRVSPGENILEGVNLRDQTGTVYVVSVSGGKMYEVGGDWTELGATKDRSGENLQLFQVITIKGDHLIFESRTAIGELYDSFELIKTVNGPNKFIELRAKAIDEKIESGQN
ncbi:metallophosphoesterase family protein [Algoriphagus sp.]|uniref:purple acid phosphatase family protein n=1 Tax=Algoriphagus sp. TaxID=1872435 RepID=UPI0025DF46CC|nr:metallophosphoesterase family protein [Algoriphagus sp.]